MEQDKLKDFRSRLKKYIPIMKDAREKTLNEADTRMRIRVLLSEILGYDMLEEITQEHMVQGHYVDLTVKAAMWDKSANKYISKIIFFVEAKSVDTTLRDTHVYQATSYASNGGINLVILTNGIDYRLYHLTWDKAKVESNLVLSLNVLDDPVDILAEKLYLLSKESFKKGVIDKYISEKTSLSDRNIAQVLLSPRVLTAMRLELKNLTGSNIKEESLEHCLSQILDPKLYEYAKSCAVKIAKKEKKPVQQPKAMPVEATNVINLENKAQAE